MELVLTVVAENQAKSFCPFSESWNMLLDSFPKGHLLERMAKFHQGLVAFAQRCVFDILKIGLDIQKHFELG